MHRGTVLRMVNRQGRWLVVTVWMNSGGRPDAYTVQVENDVYTIAGPWNHKPRWACDMSGAVNVHNGKASDLDMDYMSLDGAPKAETLPDGLLDAIQECIDDEH